MENNLDDKNHKIEDGWSYKFDGPWTIIYDDYGNKLTTFFKKMTKDDVLIYKNGFQDGFKVGKYHGDKERSSHIIKVLGL